MSARSSVRVTPSRDGAMSGRPGSMVDGEGVGTRDRAAARAHRDHPPLPARGRAGRETTQHRTE
ncbi:hypothetical protein HGI15_15180 [Modestobacter lapidis]|nr:hypothetical protein [Modestobacter lapidis]